MGKEKVISIFLLSIFLALTPIVQAFGEPTNGAATIKEISFWEALFINLRKMFTVYPQTVRPGQEVLWEGTLTIKCPACMSGDKADLICQWYEPGYNLKHSDTLSYWTVTCGGSYLFQCKWTIPTDAKPGTWTANGYVTKTGDGTCVLAGYNEQFTVQACTDGYMDVYRCSGNIMQRKYQYSDCTTTWKDYVNCDSSDGYTSCSWSCYSSTVRKCTREYRDYYCGLVGEITSSVVPSCSYKPTDASYTESCPSGQVCSGGLCVVTTTTTTTTPTTTTTTTIPTCNNNGVCEPAKGENPSNCPGDCTVQGTLTLTFIGLLAILMVLIIYLLPKI
jgi:hypothetical protein